MTPQWSRQFSVTLLNDKCMLPITSRTRWPPYNNWRSRRGNLLLNRCRPSPAANAHNRATCERGGRDFPNGNEHYGKMALTAVDVELTGLPDAPPALLAELLAVGSANVTSTTRETSSSDHHPMGREHRLQTDSLEETSYRTEAKVTTTEDGCVLTTVGLDLGDKTIQAYFVDHHGRMVTVS